MKTASNKNVLDVQEMKYTYVPDARGMRYTGCAYKKGSEGGFPSQRFFLNCPLHTEFVVSTHSN